MSIIFLFVFCIDIISRVFRNGVYHYGRTGIYKIFYSFFVHYSSRTKRQRCLGMIFISRGSRNRVWFSAGGSNETNNEHRQTDPVNGTALRSLVRRLQRSVAAKDTRLAENNGIFFHLLFARLRHVVMIIIRPTHVPLLLLVPAIFTDRRTQSQTQCI